MSGRDHGGALDAAIAEHGGTRADWIDLSTGINPVPYPLPDLPADAWTALPDRAAVQRLERAARAFWRVPDTAACLAAPGASSLIARIPTLRPAGRVAIPRPTYNEHEAAFAAAGWQVRDDGTDARVVVHPNNPDGVLADPASLDARFVVIDESFMDLAPDLSLVSLAARPNTLVLKSFGKFWGLAGLRLGFAIGAPDLVARLGEMLGPWPVSGPALSIGAAALEDTDWAPEARARLVRDAARLDDLATGAGAGVAGGTALYRLYGVSRPGDWARHFASHRILVRTFPHMPDRVRFGLPAPSDIPRLEAAFAALSR